MIQFDRSKLKINKGVIWIKIGFCLFSLGNHMVVPFLPLQLANIGLNDKEISYVLGIMPFLLILTMPVSGYLGDKIGYKPILIWDAIIVGSAYTSYMFIPTAKVSIRSPFVDIGPGLDDHTFPLMSVNWPLCSGDKDLTDIQRCRQSWLADSDTETVQDFLAGINSFVNCQDGNITISVPVDLYFNNVTSNDEGTFCNLKAEFEPLSPGRNNTVRSCDLKHPNLTNTCTTNSDDHSKAFWIVFLVTLVLKIHMNSGFALLDGISIRFAQMHNSSYTSFMLWCDFFNAIAPFLASLTIRDSSTFGETDYSLTYYTCDGILFLAIIVYIFKLDTTVKRDTVKQESMLTAIQKILSVPFAMLLFAVFIAGLMWGIHDTYLYLYLQRDLGASSQLISYSILIAWVSTLLFLLFTSQIVSQVGEMNIIFVGLSIELTRLIIYSYWIMTPPYYMLGLHCLEFTQWGWAWIATIEYGYKITPPQYAATVTSIVALVEFIISKSLAILIGGQLREIMTVPELFRASAITTAALGALLAGMYYCFGRKSEQELVKRLNKEYPDRFTKSDISHISILGQAEAEQVSKVTFL